MARGTVYKYRTTRSNSLRWGYVVDLPGPGRKQQRRQGFPTRTAAEASLDQLRHKLSGYYIGQSPTLTEYSSQWLATASMNLAPNTIKGYEKNLRLYLLPSLGPLLLDEVTPLHLDALYSELLKTLAPRTVQHVHVTASKLWSDAIRKGLASRNPATTADSPSNRIDRVTPAVWTAAELAQALASLKDRRDFPLWYVAAHTGMRRGELAGLVWGDLDKGRLSISKAMTDDGVAPTKTRKGRTVSLDPGTQKVLRKWRNQVVKDALQWGWSLTEDSPMFVWEDGRRYSLNYLSTFPRLLPKDLPRVTFQGLRHTHATILLAEGVNPKKVSERLGHSSIQVTMDIYSHVTPEMDDSVADVFAAAVGDLSQYVTGAPYQGGS